MEKEKETDVFILSEEQIKALDEAEKQYQRGEVIPHEEVMKEMRELLKNKDLD